MKKYFAKYFPVEGEIKEDDAGLYPPLNFIGILTYKNRSEVGARYCGHYLINDKDFLGVTPSLCKKVKLFLCSRDIQVGDRSYNPETNRDCLIINEVQQGKVLKAGCFKVIGEISPDALSYVKEGQEFDENEVRKVVETELYYADAEEQYQKWGGIIGVEETYVPHGKQTPTHHETIIDERIEVKGPCGHFH